MNTNMIAQWILLCALAEFFGIGAAALWYGSMNVLFGEPTQILARTGVWALMSLSAVPEGIILGGLQAIGIRWFLPNVHVFRWVMATIIVGLLGWGMGTAIPMFFVTQSPSPAATEPGLAATIFFAAIFGLVTGAVFGLAQASVLPSDLRGKAYWTLANMVGWALGLPAIYVCAQIAGEFAGWPSRIALWALGGLGAGGSIGVATSMALLKIASDSSKVT